MHIEFIIKTDDAGSLEKLRQSAEELKGQGHRVESKVTEKAGDAARFAREAVAHQADLVISVGGDGTLNEVVNGILPPPGTPLTARTPRLGIVPLGTGNDFAGFMQIPEDIQEAVTFAVQGPETLVDVAILNGRYFVNVSNAGLSAEATADTPSLAKRFLGGAAYVLTGAKTFAALNTSHARFTSDGVTVFDGPFLLFAVGNGGRAGGGSWITPHADPTDGLLDLCIVGDMGRAELAKLLPGLRAGNHPDHELVTYRKLSSIRVEPVGDFSANMDGEPVVASVFEYSIVPRALRFVANRGWELDFTGSSPV